MSSVTLVSFVIAATLPLLLKRMSRGADGPVHLSTLSIILFVLLGLFIVTTYAHEELSAIVANIYLIISYRLFAAIVSVVVVLKLTPFASDFSKLIKFPMLVKNWKNFCLILLFVLYVGTNIICGIRFYPEKILADSGNILVLEAVIKKPIIWLPAILLTILFSAVGEELVFRYAAITALRNKFNDLIVVVSSAVIWTLFHFNISFYLFGLGLLFSYLFIRTKSLSLNIILHFIYNVAISAQVFYLYFQRWNTLDGR